MIDTQKLKPTRISQTRCILLLIIMLSIYLIDNIQLFYFNKFQVLKTGLKCIGLIAYHFTDISYPI